MWIQRVSAPNSILVSISRRAVSPRNARHRPCTLAGLLDERNASEKVMRPAKVVPGGNRTSPAGAARRGTGCWRRSSPSTLVRGGHHQRVTPSSSLLLAAIGPRIDCGRKPASSAESARERYALVMGRADEGYWDWIVAATSSTPRRACWRCTVSRPARLRWPQMTFSPRIPLHPEDRPKCRERSPRIRGRERRA